VYGLSYFCFCGQSFSRTNRLIAFIINDEHCSLHPFAKPFNFNVYKVFLGTGIKSPDKQQLIPNSKNKLHLSVTIYNF